MHYIILVGSEQALAPNRKPDTFAEGGLGQTDKNRGDVQLQIQTVVRFGTSPCSGRIYVTLMPGLDWTPLFLIQPVHDVWEPDRDDVSDAVLDA